MRNLSITAAALLCAVTSPAIASSLLPATNNVTFTAFDTTTQGSLLISKAVSGTALTFAGTANLAVYRNSSNTLDFYYQFVRTGAGLLSNDAVETITGANFAGYTIDAMFSDADPDGTGLFAASTNVGAPATAQRNANGGVVGVDFAPSNPVAGQENSATYIFRTNAVNYDDLGTFGVIDGSTFSGAGFQPSAAVPEVGTWAMFIVGFGGIGLLMRGQRKGSAIAI